MLISHHKKFIYTKTIKTAGTSVEAYFERYCMPEDNWEPIHYRKMHSSEIGVIGQRGDCSDNPEWWNHMPAKMIRDKVGEHVWKHYFKFCMIRNPYEKALSAFFHFKFENRYGIADFEGDDKAKFSKYLELIGPPVDCECYMIDGKICMDFFIRYENLACDMSKACKMIGVPWDPDLLPNYKSEFRPCTANLVTYYTSATKKIIDNLYEFELNYFDYTFPY